MILRAFSKDAIPNTSKKLGSIFVPLCTRCVLNIIILNSYSDALTPSTLIYRLYSQHYIVSFVNYLSIFMQTQFLKDGILQYRHFYRFFVTTDNLRP